MSTASPSIAALSAVPVTAATLPEATRDLPSFVRTAFGYATRLNCGSLTAQLPDGRRYLFSGAAPGPSAEIVIHDLSFGRRLLEGGDIGFAEAYIAGEWDTPDLTAFLYLFCLNHEAVATLLPGRPIVKMLQRFRHWLNRNSKSGSKRNIHAHYDIGNAFYSQWLDRTMTYSSALFAPGDNDLASAQTRKYRALAEDGGIRAGETVLEIGCGWGGFAEFAAPRGRLPRDGSHDLAGAVRLRPQADLRGGAQRARRDQAAGLPRRARRLRPHRLDRDVRSRGRAILAFILRATARPAARWRHRGAADHHDPRTVL